MQIFRRRATEEEMAAGREEILREQEKLAREALEERTGGGDSHQETQVPSQEERDPPVALMLGLSSQHKSEGVQNLFTVEKKLIWEIPKSWKKVE